MLGDKKLSFFCEIAVNVTMLDNKKPPFLCEIAVNKVLKNVMFFFLHENQINHFFYLLCFLN